MKSKSCPYLVTAVFALSILIGQAKADIPPPPPSDFVETCTIQQKNLQGKDCVICPTSADEPEKCYRERSPDGYRLFCRTGGESPREIWCRGLDASNQSDSETRNEDNASDVRDDGARDDSSSNATCSIAVRCGDAGGFELFLYSATAILCIRRRFGAPGRLRVDTR